MGSKSPDQMEQNMGDQQTKATSWLSEERGLGLMRREWEKEGREGQQG